MNSLKRSRKKVDAPHWLGLREMVQKELVKRGKAD